jgi:hypothetical protein
LHGLGLTCNRNGDSSGDLGLGEKQGREACLVAEVLRAADSGSHAMAKGTAAADWAWVRNRGGRPAWLQKHIAGQIEN